MDANFGNKPDDLKSAFKSLRTRLEQLDASWSYTRKPVAEMVPDAAANETVEVTLNPWQLSFNPALSLKGKSKMVNVLRCAMDFLENPYNSLENPIHVNFSAAPGSKITDFSVGHGVGFAKSIAVKLVLLGTVALEFPDAELLLVLNQLKACYHFRCTYKTAGSMRADRFRVLQEKFGESARSRPDPIQIFHMLVAQANDESLQWSDACQTLIAEFNSSTQNEDRKLTDLEVSIVKIYPSLDADTRKLIDYHWQNYKVKQSALPFGVLSSEVFASGMKPKKGMESELWSTILSLDNRKRHWYVMRKVQFFLFRLADAKRLKKKTNLASLANQLRSPEDAAMAWAMACVFAHFLASWQAMLGETAVNLLVEKYGRGYLDVELQEKVRALNPKLTAASFRFLTDVGMKV